METIKQIEAFSNVVEHIYDAAVDPNHWHETLLHLRQFVGASSASLLYSGDVNAENAFPNLLFLSGYSESFIKALRPEYWSIWALQVNVPAWPVGAVNHLGDMLPREEFLNGRFYREVLQPHKQLDYIGMMALKEGLHAVHLNLSTTVDDGPFFPQSVELMRLLAPHVCRAAKIGLALDVKTLQTKQLESTLNSLSAGVYLIHQDGRIVFMNRAAEQQIKRGIGIKIVNNRLVPRDQAAANVFAKNFVNRNEANGNNAPEAISIAFPDKAGSLVATILSLSKGQRQNLTTGTNSAAFAVFLQDPNVAPSPPGVAVAKLYGLTPAEQRVLLTMAQGYAAQETADILGVSLATVKTHVQHILQKTGTNRLVDVVRMMMQASSPAVARQDPQ